MSEPEKPRFGTQGKLAAGGAAGFFLGLAAHRAATETPLPLETFEWVLKNGAAGFFLMGLFLVGIAYWQERKDHERTRRRKDAELEALRKEMSVADREDRPLLLRMIKVLAINSEVIRGHAITESELGEIGTTPPSPIPLPPKPGRGDEEGTT